MRFAILTILGFAVIFLAFAFVLADINPMRWDTIDRAVMMGLYAMVGLYFCIMQMIAPRRRR
jgi:hypothetical protein